MKIKVNEKIIDIVKSLNHAIDYDLSCVILVGTDTGSTAQLIGRSKSQLQMVTVAQHQIAQNILTKTVPAKTE